jgi:nitrogenase molybdenum-iron protein alpha/beta subunit
MQHDADDLPEAFKAARAKDEDFWKAQEQRIQGSLGQPCCTLSGISTQLITMSGNFAVVVHGEDECASCFRHIGPSSWNFYCTGLTEEEFVSGDTSEPLETCLRLVATEVEPEAIFVLGACPVEVIGDRFEVVVERVNEEFPHIPMMALHTSGLKVGSQAAMLDWIWSTIATLPTRTPVSPAWRRNLYDTGERLTRAAIEHGSQGLALDDTVRLLRGVPDVPAPTPDEAVAFIGLPRIPRREGADEHRRVLEAAGLTIVGAYPFGADWDAWRAIGFPKNSFVVDRSIYPKLIKELEKKGQVVSEVPLPTGVEQTDAFYRMIGEATGKLDEILALTAPARAAALEAVEAFRARYGGLRVAMGIRMVNNYAADQVAYHGLGDFKAIEELGFKLTVMVQGPPDRKERMGETLRRRGIDLPFEMFPEPWTLSNYIGGGRYDVAYMADHCQTECRKAGLPMIVSRALDPFYAGVKSNLDYLERLLRDLRPGGAE